MAHYSFTTLWKLNAPLENVWQEIHTPQAWPDWWKGVEEVVDVTHGDNYGIGSITRFTWKSKLPYRLSFNSRVTLIEPFKRIEGIAFGELDGKGIWTFTNDNGITTVRYDWKVKTTKWWMNAIAPLARPAFTWNHDVIMNWGGQGLAKRLNCLLIN